MVMIPIKGFSALQIGTYNYYYFISIYLDIDRKRQKCYFVYTKIARKFKLYSEFRGDMC